MSGSEQWARVVEEWRSSGQTPEAFCAGRALRATGLTYWASRIRRERAAEVNRLLAAPVRIAKVVTRRSPMGSAGPTVSEVVRDESTGISLVIAGAEVRVERDFDEATLRRVLDALTSTTRGRR